MNAKAAVCAVLALFLLSATLTDGVPLAQVENEIQCQGVGTHSQFIHPKHIQAVKLTQIRTDSEDVVVIATLKDGREVCLDSTAAWVKRIIKAMVDRAPANAESQL